jgi:hypothetical protein
VRITVIATGFGEPVPSRPGVRPRPASPEPASEYRGMQATADGRPIVRHGLREPVDELDVPTWQRRQQAPPVPSERQAAAPQPSRRPVANGADNDDQDYDIPTFLRRGAD